MKRAALTDAEEKVIGRLMDEHLDLYLLAIQTAFGLQEPGDFGAMGEEVDDALTDAAGPMEDVGRAFLARYKDSARQASRTRLASAHQDDQCEVGPAYVRCKGRIYRKGT